MTYGSDFRYLVHRYCKTLVSNMQNKEKTPKKVGRPGFTDKRFWMRNEHKEAVISYQRILAKQKDTDVNWEQALEYLIETHPQTKKLMPI